MDPAEIQAAALAAVPTYAEGMTVPRLNQHFDGVRRILRRHAPMPNGSCTTCCTNEYSVDPAWPCLDWRDAAAGLPLGGTDG